jgi:hypothetical protein
LTGEYITLKFCRANSHYVQRISSIFVNVLSQAPDTQIRFTFDLSPDTIETEPLETPKAFERNLTISSLAAPSTGGDAIRRRSVPSSPLSNSDFDARGTTRTENVTRSPSIDTSGLIAKTHRQPQHGEN